MQRLFQGISSECGAHFKALPVATNKHCCLGVVPRLIFFKMVSIYDKVFGVQCSLSATQHPTDQFAIDSTEAALAASGGRSCELQYGDIRADAPSAHATPRYPAV